MKEGYDGDDTYIMVEDEFRSVAQTFTQHLHHAEYQRLKKKAKNAAPPTFPPTGTMRAETRKKTEARALRVRQKDALGDFTNGVTLSAAEDEEQEDDPWLGTSLAGLMTDRNNSKRMALVGLEKVQSSTRAAKGFGRGTGDTPADRKEKMSVFDIFSPQSKGSGDVLEQEKGTQEDDLNPSEATIRPSRPTSRGNLFSKESSASHRHISGAASSTATPNREPPTAEGPHGTSQAQSRRPSVAARRLLDDHDNFEGSEEHSHPSTNHRHPSSRKNHKSKATTDRKTQMDDIPTFLV